jgi:predicted RNase H-like HicB family nuclease
MKLCIQILRSEDGGYTATCSSLPGCITRGASKEEARERLDEAIRGYVAAVSNFVPENLLEEVVEV